MIAEKYASALEDPANNLVRASCTEENVFHHFVIRAKSRSGFQKAMSDQNVMTDIHYPYFFNSLAAIRAKYEEIGKALPDIGNSETLANEVVSLPIGPWMSGFQIELVASVLDLKKIKDLLVC